MLPTVQRYAYLRYAPPVVITWSLGGPTVGGAQRDGSMLGEGARGKYLGKLGGMAWARD